MLWKGDALLRQLVGGQAQPLLARAGLTGPDVDALSRRVGGADHAERGAVAAGGERAGVADGEDVRPVGHEFRAVPPDGEVHLQVLPFDRLRLIEDALGRQGGEAFERPEQVDRRGPRGGEGPFRLVQTVAPAGGEGHTVRGGDADGGRAPHRHLPDRPRDRLRVAQFQPLLPSGQDALVQHPQAVPRPLHRLDTHAYSVKCLGLVRQQGNRE